MIATEIVLFDTSGGMEPESGTLPKNLRETSRIKSVKFPSNP
jgi:hypothetical protein